MSPPPPPLPWGRVFVQGFMSFADSALPLFQACRSVKRFSGVLGVSGGELTAR